MGSEKLSPVKMALLRGLVASTRLTLIERKSVRALLDAYEATQRPIEPEPKREKCRACGARLCSRCTTRVRRSPYRVLLDFCPEHAEAATVKAVANG